MGFAGVRAAAPAGANDLCVGAGALCVLSGVLGGGAGVLCMPPSRAVVDSNVHGCLFSVSRARHIEYAVLRSADGRLGAMHSRSRVVAARLGGSASQRNTESSRLCIAIGALCAPTGTLRIVLNAIHASRRRTMTRA